MVSHRCFTLPRSSILCGCGCINISGRQVNAVWGRYPTACTMCAKKQIGVHWGSSTKSLPPSSRDACLSRTCGSSYPGSIYPLRSEFASRPPPPALAGDGSTVVLCHPLCAALSSVLSSRASLHFASAPLEVFTRSQSLFSLLLRPTLT
jgi:hypothetical protein